jgi:hypothetical protein
MSVTPSTPAAEKHGAATTNNVPIGNASAPAPKDKGPVLLARQNAPAPAPAAANPKVYSWDDAKLIEHNFKETSLFRTITDDKTVYHLIAHRSATLIPANQQGQ